MQRITAICALVLSGAAHAHELPGEDGILAQLGHEVLGLHHLPFTVLLIVVLAAALGWARYSRSRSE